jgi:hypothetical protein
MALRSAPLEERFWSRVDRRGPNDCWPWLGKTSHNGYGVLSKPAGSWYRATRVSWSLANGRPFPEDKQACHSCDNRICVNPAHIWPGTNAENKADSRIKGRTKRGPVLPATAGVCAYDTDECTVTLALDDKDQVLTLVKKLPSKNRVRICP